MLLYDPDIAIGSLRATDPQMADLIDRVGEFRLPLRANLNPFEALMRSVVYQAISKRAAQAVERRVYALFPECGPPQADDVFALTDEALRAAGLSRGKIATIKGLATATAEGVIPSRQDLLAMEDTSIIDRLTTLRGIGPWTVEMLLIFNLGRPDVLPATDLGVRNGFKIAFGKDVAPSPKDLACYGQRWRPYRTVASWYLWRANDL